MGLEFKKSERDLSIPGSSKYQPFGRCLFGKKAQMFYHDPLMYPRNMGLDKPLLNQRLINP